MESLFHLLVQVGKKIEDKASAALKRNINPKNVKGAAKGEKGGKQAAKATPEPQKNIIQSYFDRIRKLMENKTNGLSSRARFRLQDLLDLRESGWKKRSTMLGENGPVKIGDIHKKAAEKEQKDQIEMDKMNKAQDYGNQGGYRVVLKKIHENDQK